MIYGKFNCAIAHMSFSLRRKKKKKKRFSIPQVLADVTEKAAAAEVVKASVQKVKDKAQHLVDEIEAEKAVAFGKLEAAAPALEQAEAALQVNIISKTFWC